MSMTTRSSRVENVTLPAKVVQDQDGYLATIDNLDVTGSGPTESEAQDDLVDKFMTWVQTREGQGTLEAVLSEAGYQGVDGDTELVLEFTE